MFAYLSLLSILSLFLVTTFAQDSYVPRTESIQKNETCKNVQAPRSYGNPQRAEAIKEAFRHGWNGYKKYASGFDELLPLSANGSNSFYGWQLYSVDALDTAIIMGLDDIVEEMLQTIAKVDFSKTDNASDPVNLFETNIRFIGGLISAHDLLKSGEFPNHYESSLVDRLLEQATVIANKIAFAFNTPSGLPVGGLLWQSNTLVPDTYTDEATNITYNSTNTASGGTFLLDWTRLSDLTGNDTYRKLVEKTTNVLTHPNPAPTYPGLDGTQFDTDTGKMLTFDGGWEAGVDSFLEYLIKTYQYNPSLPDAGHYRDFWLSAVDSTQQHLAVHPYGFPDLTFLALLDKTGEIHFVADHFSCFAGGNFLLGGALLDSSPLTALGVAWSDGCHTTYNTTLTGLGPLAWAWYNASNQATNPLADNDAAARKNAAKRGFYIMNRAENWFLRPEPIESIFYGHRITGNERWAEYNWEIFQAINETARTEIAFASVRNVDMPFGGSMANYLDSFFFAEVLKYLYLTFVDSDVIDLSQWVFNTEGHPFRNVCASGNTKRP